MSSGLPGFYRDRRVAVTGATGYLGAALMRELSRHGAQAQAFSVRHATNEDWDALVASADVIFHLAGNTSVARAERDPEFSHRATIEPVDRVVTRARVARRQPRIVFASTATVYGLTDVLPVDEGREPDPQTTYDRHKLEAEHRLVAAADAVDAVVLRLSNVYGPSPAASQDRSRGFLNRAAADALRGHKLSVYGDGAYIRDFVHTDDVVRALLMCGLPGPGHRCFNVGSGAGTAMIDALAHVVQRAARITGRRVDVCRVPWPSSSHPIDRRSYIADTRRIREDLGWEPRISIEEGIGTLCDDCADKVEHGTR